VQDPVRDGLGDQGVAEDLVPLREARSEAMIRAPFLAAAGDELEEQVGAVAVDRACTRSRR
jgi:hypothetical protein